MFATRKATGKGCTSQPMCGHVILLAVTFQLASVCTAQQNEPGYLGCFEDQNDNRVLNTGVIKRSDQSVEWCFRYCLERIGPYTYAGLEFGEECFCGSNSNYDRHGRKSNSDCGRRCKGNRNQICGDEKRISIYRISRGACANIGQVNNGNISNITNPPSVSYNLGKRKFFRTRADLFCERGYYGPATVKCSKTEGNRVKWDPEPVCRECTPIANCLRVFCSNAYDQKCDQCDGDYGTNFGSAYNKSDDQRRCIKQCSWRANSNACYPGSCSNGRCTCSSGFSGQDCRTITQAPVFSEYRATLIMGTTKLESPTVTNSTATVYTNVLNFENITVNWKSSYQPTGLPNSRHPYVDSSDLGIVAADVAVSVNRAEGGRHPIGSWVCPQAGSRSEPAKDFVVCERTFRLDYRNWTPTTGDVLACHVTSTNGGNLKLLDWDNGGSIITRYYSGSTVSGSPTFTFDFVDPYHCADASSVCRTTMLSAGADVTTEATIRVTWQGWADDVAGIKEYDLQIRQLSGSRGGEMTESFDGPAVYSDVTNSGQTITLPHIGVYSIVLTVVDNAGNHKLSRRFVLFDDDPDDVTIDANGSLHVLSATKETGYKWLISLGPNGGKTSVVLDWTNRFMNVYHLRQGLLQPIGSYVSATIDSAYDQNFGRRGRAAIPNVFGVTQFRVLHDIDHSGGRTTVSASDNNSDNWIIEDLSTQATYDLPLIDGDSIRFWVEARDIAGHFVRESALVHVDSSPPIIEYFWLERDGEVNITMHNKEDLDKMRVVFRTYDMHSGVKTIEWRLFGNNTGNETQQGHLAAIKIDPGTRECDLVSCLCVPVGDCYQVDYGFSPNPHISVHDYDYFITLTVTNNARLVTTETIQITVDISPPQAGVVHDGIRGSEEVDFQEGSDLSAHWEGFFDKESGIKFYQFLFDTFCWNDTTMIGTVRNYMSRTTSTHASWTAPSPGLYYVTVIAYNRALEPSEPVCSDGVMIDKSPPGLSRIAISSARVWPGLAKDDEGRVWFIDEYRRKRELVSASNDCSSKASVVDDLSVYPELTAFNDSSVILEGDLHCRWITGIEEKFYLPTHEHVALSWTGFDAESSIFDYKIGLGSVSTNPIPDLVTFTSTSGHDHYKMYHPHISHGSVFHLVVKAVNKAKLSTTKIIGPIIVDTTPPMFVGNVSVHVDGDFLVAEWGDEGFVDNADTSMHYQVGIGSSPGGTETLAFQREKDYKIGPCLTQTSCAAFLLDNFDWHLHGDHEYYVSVRAQNGAGLATVGTSSVYRHIVQLPSLGVVLDVAPPGEETDVDLGIAKDIDVQRNTTSISARWFGFEHPHLKIRYEIGVGSEEGSSDVSDGFMEVGEATQYRLEGLGLTPLRTYFVTVRAKSEAGSVNVSSDGVKVIQDGQILNGATVKDGLGCNSQNTSPLLDLSHHLSAPRQPCEDDITYQSSTSDISARWNIPKILLPFVTNVLWTVEQEVETFFDDDNTTTEWIPVFEDHDLGMAFQHVGADVGLYSGAHYRSKIQFCHVDVCFRPIVTDGFWVLSKPPEVGEVQVRNVEIVHGRTEILVTFQKFAHNYVRHDDPQKLIDFYEWNIVEDGRDGAVLSQWATIEDFDITGDMVRFTAWYSGRLDHDVCLRLSVRGYNKAGLSSTASTEILDCDDVTLIVPHVVIDADHEVALEQNAQWREPDKNYISSTTSLSAVWPTLRHRAYVWAAIEDTGSPAFGNLNEGLRYPCDYPVTKACGETEKEFINVPDLSLTHGKRYRICVHADEVTLKYEHWSQTLPAVSSCSDGVVVDTTPPTPGSVWIGWKEHQTFQSSTSELVLHWESFVDIEEHDIARHHSGIKYYEYAIGSTKGGSDVREFTRVGITNNAIVHNLILQNGHKYYATIKATDFVGLSAQTISDSITIDTSPPKVSAEHTLDVGGSIITSTASISANWENVFSDKESGIAYYEWAVGSHPGHADTMPFTRENTESGVSDSSRPLNLQEGHSYFVSVKAINNVGLITLRSFGAFTVDETSPLAGHVCDGNRTHAPANHRDQDFQEDRTVIQAFWEGFHDPHSTIMGYSWKAGTCKGCSDVVTEQLVGMDTVVSAGHLHLVPGLTYYVTVTACNAAELCTSVTSDGVLVDNSPPVAGRVYDGGPESGDLSYQSSRLQLSAHWWGFHDPHSGLSHYEWRAGTAPGADDILPTVRVELSEDALIFLSASDQMPLGSDIYITVRAYNRLGMWSEATSNGFRVDSSPPDVVNAPAVNKTVGMAVNNTQVLCDIIHFTWLFEDQESGIKNQYVSVSTHHNGDINLLPVEIAGTEMDHTFTSLTLHEGSRYIITVVACNFAGLCTEAKAGPILVDCSPPSVGTFAVGTERAANLDRHQITWIIPTEPAKTSVTKSTLQTGIENSTAEFVNFAMYSVNPTTAASGTDPTPTRRHSGWMTWLKDTSTSTSSLALAWLGFADLHSGISHYLLSVGSTYGGSEFTPNGPVRVDHTTGGMSLDEGIAQTAIIPLEGSITDLPLPYLYISIWALNGVGIPSGRHHSTFEVSPTSPFEGALVLLRRCSPMTCEGHCACAPKDGICTSRTPGQHCYDVTDNILFVTPQGNPNTEIEVLDVLDLTFGDVSTLVDIDHTPTQYMIAAAWQVTQQKGLDIKWFEWSIGDDTSSSVQPIGVFDSASEREWFDVGQDNYTVIILDRKLITGVKYHVFIRAWYDAETYAMFKSDGFIPDPTPPKVSKIRGTKIKDLARAGAGIDTDYIMEPSVLYISWEGVFLDDAVSYYQVSLSTHPGGDNIRQFANNTLPANETTIQFTDLNLESGQRYYSNVRAFNKAGLHTLRSSDGFVVDTRRPNPGLVFDGIDLHDVEYQNSSTLISASWHGFVDLESYIDHYEWCVGRSPSPADDGILPCTDVGVHLSASKRLDNPLLEGIRYYSKISAIDAAGHQSMSVSSDGFVVDTSPPEPQERILMGDNLILNPSFEEIDEPNNTVQWASDEEGLINGSVSDNNATAVPYDAGGTLSPDDDILKQIPVSWEVTFGSHLSCIKSENTVAQDGRIILALHGSIFQTFNTTPGSHYQVIFSTSHVVPSHDPLLNQEGRIEAPGLNRVFRLYDRPPHSHSDQSLESIRWHQHRFYFTASDWLSILKLSSVGRSNGILLDNIQVMLITTRPSAGDGSVKVHTQFIHSWSSVQAKWHFIDPESPIVDYSWAIGTTRGGTQLQTFKSVGTQTDAINTDLKMAHGSNVFVTVTARNAADLIAIATSDPVLIDLTAPVIQYVIDGDGTNDTDFTADDSSLSFSWSASDTENGIEHCEWAVGSEPGLDDILQGSTTPNSTFSITTSLSQPMVENQRLFATVTCYNHAEQSTRKSSNGVTITTQPPVSSGAVVEVYAVSETQFITQDRYQSQRNSLKASWDGFEDPVGIKYYECHLSGPGSSTSSWTRCGAASETHFNWSGLSLSDDATYSLSVRAVSQAGLISQAISRDFMVESSVPANGDTSYITTTWLGNGTVHVGWDGLFVASSSLVYEVSLGTVPGGSYVMQWVETMETGMRVSPLAPYTDYHLTVTAINAAGLPKTVTKIINDG